MFKGLLFYTGGVLCNVVVHYKGLVFFCNVP